MERIRFSRAFRGILGLIVLSLVFTGCREEEAPPEWKQVQLVYVDRPESVALTLLAKVIMETRMQLEVQVSEQTVPGAFQVLADSKADAFLDAWLPITHGIFMQEHGEKLVDLGVNYSGARMGVVVPGYVTVDSITQLRAQKEAFGGQIIAVDAGSGIMRMTDSVLAAYQLEFEIAETTAPAMASALREAIQNRKWVVATAWQPHPIFDQLDLKFLVDTVPVFGATENIHTVGRQGLDADKPEVVQFLRTFRLSPEQLSSLMQMIADPQAGDPEDEARAWMVLNREVVDTWIPAGL